MVKNQLVLIVEILVCFGVQDVGRDFERVGRDGPVSAQLAQVIDHLLRDRVHPLPDPEVVDHPVPDVVDLADVDAKEAEHERQVKEVASSKQVPQSPHLR